MKLISKADLYNRTNRELEGLKEEFSKVAGNCEVTRHEAYAAIQDIRTVQGQRRTTRPNQQQQPEGCRCSGTKPDGG